MYLGICGGLRKHLSSVKHSNQSNNMFLARVSSATCGNTTAEEQGSASVRKRRHVTGTKFRSHGIISTRSDAGERVRYQHVDHGSIAIAIAIAWCSNSRLFLERGRQRIKENPTKIKRFRTISNTSGIETARVDASVRIMNTTVLRSSFFRFRASGLTHHLY